SCLSTLPFYSSRTLPHLHSFPTRRSSDLAPSAAGARRVVPDRVDAPARRPAGPRPARRQRVRPGGEGIRAGASQTAEAGCVPPRSEEHTSELQSPDHLVCRLLLEKKNKKQ